MKVIILLLAMVGVLSIISWGLNVSRIGTDKETERVCAELAPIRIIEYQNTEWEDMDFYKSCLDNIRCTSPLYKCRG